MDRSLPRLALVAFVLVVVCVLVLAGATGATAFGTHNPSWDGTSEFRGLADESTATDVVRNASAYDDRVANGTLAVVLSPAEPYDERAASIRRFVERGGTVLIAEDYRPHANALLADVGASARFDGQPVRDERNYEQSPELAEVTVEGDDALTGDAETLVLNRGTVVEPGEAAVLARTTDDAYLDGDRDGTLNEDETPASRPVMTVESVGDGRVITLSDPSVFINAMLDRGDNRALAGALVDGHDRVVFDVSHAGGLPPLVAAVVTLRDSATLQLAAGVILVVLVAGRRRFAVLVERYRDWRSGRPDETPLDPVAVTEGVLSEHPEWDEGRVRRVAERVVDEESSEPAGSAAASADESGS